MLAVAGVAWAQDQKRARHGPAGSLVESQAGRVSLRKARPQSLPGGEVRVEDESRKTVTVVEAAEYLGLSRSTVQEMVDRGILKAEKFAGAVHIPREEVERIERETAP
jgi:excisionase family DNA binding protein